MKTCTCRDIEVNAEVTKDVTVLLRSSLFVDENVRKMSVEWTCLVSGSGILLHQRW